MVLMLVHAYVSKPKSKPVDAARLQKEDRKDNQSQAGN